MHAAARGFGCRGDAHAARLVEACSYVEEGRLHYVIARLGPQNPAHAARVRRRLVAHAAKQGPHHYRLFFSNASLWDCAAARATYCLTHGRVHGRVLVARHSALPAGPVSNVANAAPPG